MNRADILTYPDSRRRAEKLADAFLRALACAHEFIGATSPNPPVGCALLDADGEILAVAAHEKAGQAHAEAAAITRCRDNGSIARLHTLIVTLEPCTHQGRTPPCADAILATPARDIWIGASDPNPSVAGGGARKLQNSGLSVNLFGDLPHPNAGLFAQQAARLIAPFAKHRTTGIPWITLKQALNTKGNMIPPKGTKTFTSPSSLAFAHKLRKRADAILTGSGTILADDPAFTIRHVADFPDKTRPLIIVDRRGRVPASYLEAARAHGFDPQITTSFTDALSALGKSGVLEVLIEAGPILLDYIVLEGLWDEHAIIHQAALDGEQDQITQRYRIPLPTQGGADVFRHN